MRWSITIEGYNYWTYSNSKSDINEAAVLYPRNGYTDMSKQYENGLYSAEDDHTGLSLVSVLIQNDTLLGWRKHVMLKL